jgi:ribosomal protein L40E
VTGIRERKGALMQWLRCERCMAAVAPKEAVCRQCGATGPGTPADRLAPGPYGPPVARLRPTAYGPPALASAHDALQQETQRRAAVVPAEPGG